MKKLRNITFILAFVILFTLTGCGKKVKCEKAGDSVDTRVLFKYDSNNEVTSIEYKLTFKDEDVANTLYEYYSNMDDVSDLKLDGKVLTYTTNADTFESDLYAVDKKIDTFKAILEGEGYSCR